MSVPPLVKLKSGFMLNPAAGNHKLSTSGLVGFLPIADCVLISVCGRAAENIRNDAWMPSYVYARVVLVATRLGTKAVSFHMVFHLLYYRFIYDSALILYSVESGLYSLSTHLITVTTFLFKQISRQDKPRLNCTSFGILCQRRYTLRKAFVYKYKYQEV
jgi:hypothetical protein